MYLILRIFLNLSKDFVIKFEFLIFTHFWKRNMFDVNFWVSFPVLILLEHPRNWQLEMYRICGSIKVIQSDLVAQTSRQAEEYLIRSPLNAFFYKEPSILQFILLSHGLCSRLILLPAYMGTDGFKRLCLWLKSGCGKEGDTSSNWVSLLVAPSPLLLLSS